MYTVTNWPNRDPIAEAGFSKLTEIANLSVELLLIHKEYESLRIELVNSLDISIPRIGISEQAEPQFNLDYVMVENDPLNSIDYLGLIKCSTCRSVGSACKAAAFATTQACNAAVNIGCKATCTGSGPLYIACVLLCQTSGRYGCGVTGLLLTKTCDAVRDQCLDNCCE
jgi:hypothetical protein